MLEKREVRISDIGEVTELSPVLTLPGPGIVVSGRGDSTTGETPGFRRPTGG